ncbi:MAG TPA: flagellar assembly protein FliW [Longimicrobiaceae bacterium]|nr:flagellar assembly protein FliW [Longimicrobiaceae bacterium]
MTLSTALAIDLDLQPMIISSELLGPLEAQAEELFHFPQGLFGFPDCEQFVLVGAERPGLYWLQSLDLSALTFLAVDPFLYFDGYSVDLPNFELRELDVAAPDDVLVLAIVTLPPSRSKPPTANLQGPLALNVRSRMAKQIVLQGDEHGTRCPFDLEPTNPKP